MKLASRPLWRQTLFVVVAALGVLVLTLCVYVGALFPRLPGVDQLRQARIAQPSVLRALDGTPIASFSQKQQERITLKEISPQVVAALLSTEDARFYQHHGVDFRRTFSALFHTLSGDTQGGSTITQQLARNLFPEEIGRSRSLNRKAREMITALRIERAYTKEQILETYLNTVPFLYNVVGIEMAARTYYDKSAADLDVLESATLIGMLKGTSYYNPVINPERALKRRNVVLSQMVKHGMLSSARLDVLRGEPLNVHFSKQADMPSVAPHFAAYVRRWLIDWADQNDFNLDTDGLIIQTTLDLRLQEAATRAVERQTRLLQNVFGAEWGQASGAVSVPTLYSLGAEDVGTHRKIEPFRYFWASHPDLLDVFLRESPEYRQAIAQGATPLVALQKLRRDDKAMAALRAAKTRLEAGFAAMDPQSGELRAWVGSRDFNSDQYDHVIQAERQPGSTFKPFVYGAALERGIRPDHLYYDRPVVIRAADGAVWRPTDMGGSSGEPMSLRQGLIHSKNTITVQVMQEVGLPRIVNLAHAMGVNQSKLDPVPSLALGTSPVTLLEMLTAYATIAQQGEYHKPVLVRSIADRNGKIIATFSSAGASTGGVRVMSQNTALELIDMMRGVVNRGTGTAVKTRFGIVADIAGKTGTTQNNTDGWFILMHPNLVAGAWVGFNDARVTMRSNYWGQGGHNAILIVGDFFRDAMRSKVIDASARFPLPPSATLTAQGVLPDEDWGSEDDNQMAISATDGAQSSPIVIRNDGNSIIIEGGRADTASAPRSADTRPPKDAQELERILGGMGRDPATGAANAPPATRKPETASGAESVQ